MKRISGFWYAIVLALVSAALLGAATPASKSLLGSLNIFQLAGLLYLGAVLGVLLVLLRERTWRRPWTMSHRDQGHLL